MLGLKISEAIKYNEKLKNYIYYDNGKAKINFKDKRALAEYNKAILKALFNLSIEFHPKGLVPAVICRYLFIKKTFDIVKPKTVLEVGTGHSAIIAMLIKKLYNCEVYATEVDKEFLRLAKENIERNNLDIKLIDSKGKIVKGIKELEGKKFDLVISYPPFYSKNSLAKDKEFGGKKIELIGGGRFGEEFSLKLIEESLGRAKYISIMLPKKPEMRREIIKDKLKEVSKDLYIEKIEVGKRERYIFIGKLL
ncbi:RlmF-related methyltransferase [Methanocaldococcus sp.]